MNVGNQPTPAGIPPQGAAPSETKHAADVDPQKLLNMLPDLQKLARKKEAASKDTKETQDLHVTDAQAKTLADFAKMLVAEPQLPTGSKDAFDKWIGELIKQDAEAPATPQTTPDGTKVAGQTQTPTAEQQPTTPQQPAAQAQAQTGQPAPTPAPTPQTAQAQQGQPLPTPQPGQPAAQPQAQTAAAQEPQTQEVVVFGGDPQELLTDGPEVKSGPLKTLGKIASETAKAQGGQLTHEQVALFKASANDLMRSLVGADKSVLMAFLTQLEGFPASDKPKAPDAKSTNTPTKTSDSGQSGQTKSAKMPDVTALAMDELGLSDEVQKLGQQALSYVQGNGGKLSEKEAEQLKSAAEELMGQGMDGDDLKALQNFIKALTSFPRTAAGTADSPLLLTQAGINPKMITLAQYANAMVKAQNGTLTEAEVNILKNMAQEMMSELSPEDQATLKSWLNTLGDVPTTKPPKINVFHDAMMFGATPKSNPYMSPGIMAMLAPILGEIMQLNNEIIRQSSKLKQGMMKLLTAMAGEAFKYAIQAGEARAAELRNEAMMHITLGVSQIAQAGAALAMHGVSNKQRKEMKTEAKGAMTEKKMKAWANDERVSPDIRKNRNDLLDHSKTISQDPKVQAQYVRSQADHPSGHATYGGGQKGKTDFENHSFGEKAEISSQVAQRLQQSGITAVQSVVGHMGQSMDNFIQAGFKMANVKNVMDQAVANAHKEMISTLTQLVIQTMQTASDEMQTAQKNFDSFVQLYKDFANTITQSIYRNG